MNRFFRMLAITLTLTGAVAALPAVASADPQYGRHDERGNVERGRQDERGGGVERGRHDWDREGWARWERERAERARIEHERACYVARVNGAPWWQLRNMGCEVR
jgi:hypothetical protein